MSKFRVTHTAGISEVEFLPDNTTSIGWLYENHPYFSLILFCGVLLLVGWIGKSIGTSEEKEKAKKEAEKLAKTEADPKRTKAEPTPEVDPPAPS